MPSWSSNCLIILRIELINQLKAKGLNMNGIIRELAEQGKLYGEPDLYALNLNSKANNG